LSRAWPDPSVPEEIRRHTVRLLRPFRPDGATLRLIRWGEASLAVSKDFLDSPPLYRRTVGRFLIRREVAAYRRLSGVPGLPRLLAHPHPEVLILEHIPGTEVRRLGPGELPPEALSQLRQTLEGMHRAGILHLDLGHDSNGDFGRDTNMIWAERGQLYLIDLAGALMMPLPPPLFRVLARHDLLALTKLRRRFFGGTGPEPEEDLPPWAWRLFRFLRKV